MTRLLTGFAVAAAFAVGAWTMPAHPGHPGDLGPAAGPAGQPSMVSFAPSTETSASDRCAAIPPTVDGLTSGSDDRPAAGAATTPASPARPDQSADPTGVAVDDQPPAVDTSGLRCVRAPPGA
ncbi:hypothetical protein GCM10009541_10960 [Micromonospora gifhornensis]|uniref:Uncharacterized protein n=1 Tax=Micromonospora gifhornensis TaxID=84594 RepID=A0ABQ4IEE0_9ACTN|nr:hypothetical protein [Micromonospora gifhornensis]GIJ16285.1 hypothetical protein Vgi01_29690 [Micromonospora gifhornensis]